LIPCINQATVLTADTIMFLTAARKHGFTNVELDIGKVEECIKKDGLASLKRALNDNELGVRSLNAIENYPILRDDQMTKSLEHCRAVINLCNELECDVAVLNPNEFEPGKEEVTQQRFDLFVERTCEMTESHGVRLAYEYVSYDDRVTNTLMKTVRRLGIWKEQVALVLDTFHMYRTGETLDSLPAEMSDRLLIFHVNDAPSMPIDRVRDTDRVFPFEGVIDLARYMQQLHEKNFNGPISVELFNKKYWDMSVDNVIARAKQSLDRLLEA
jgi:2-keto-myo-inositol isomerase